MITLCIVPDGNRWVIEAAWTGGSERLDHRFETYGKAFSDARKMVKASPGKVLIVRALAQSSSAFGEEA